MSSGAVLKQYLDAALRRWWLLVIPPMLGVAAAAVYYRQTPKIYSASTTIEVQSTRVPQRWMTPTVNLEMEDRINLILPTLQGEENLLLVAEATGLLTPSMAPEEGVGLLGRLRAALTVEWDRRQANVFVLSVLWPDQEKVAPLTTAFTDRFIQEHQGLRRQRAAKMLDFASEQVRKADDQLKAKRDEYSEFQRRYYWSLPKNLHNSHRKIEGNVTEIESLNGEVDNAWRRIREIEAERDLQALTPGVTAAGPRSADQQLLESTQSELDRARATLSDRHPRVVALRRQVESLQARVAAAQPATPEEQERTDPRWVALNLEAEALQERIERADARKAELNEENERFRRFIDQSADVASRDAEYEQDLTLLTDAFNDAMLAETEARKGERLEESGQGETPNVLIAAVRPNKPAQPDLMKLLIVGLMLGGVVGAGAAFGLEAFDQSYKSEDDLAADIDLPILTTIPNLDASARQLRKAHRKRGSGERRRSGGRRKSQGAR
jgi:uncharacterized protein involved in exopolysaccharide biosynthesis